MKSETMVNRYFWLPLLLSAVLLLAGCGRSELGDNAARPTATVQHIQPTIAPIPTRDPNFVVIATDAPLPPFTSFDRFGVIEGFDKEIMDEIAAAAGLEYEFVVTPSQGVLDLLATGDGRDFDAVMSSLLVNEAAPQGIAFTEPYLEVGQVMLVLADEDQLQTAADLQPGTAVGVQSGSQGEITARDLLRIQESDLFNEYEKPNQVVQALIDETVRAIILDSASAEYFAGAFPEQLQIAGGTGRDAWISAKSYGIAVNENNTLLLNRLNEAISEVQQGQAYQEITVSWLILDDARAETVDPGESRVGTPEDEFFIGMIGQAEDLDPATNNFDFINWEIMRNTMSGLYGFNADNELQPLLAEDFPQISEDKLEYTIRLKSGLAFPDGSELTAEDVRWSVIRASRLGNFVVNTILKDTNEDNFADADAVQVLDETTIKFILNEPAAFFPNLLASPPFYPISSECFAETADPGSSCGGIGPYTISSWEGGDRIRLQSNPDWPAEPAPQTPNITVRFYSSVEELQRSLAEFQSIDLAWTGLPFDEFLALQSQDSDLDGQPDFVPWDGPSTFKSYLIFEQSAPPWDNKKVRQAVSYALDRQAIIDTVFPQRRLALRSPIPDDVPGALATLPDQDLEQVASLMLEAGYTAENPLVMSLSFVDDGRYSDVEEQYVRAIAGQLEATGLFQVEVAGAPWDQFRVQMSECAYPAFLLGWPTPGRPVDYLDPSSWTDFFVQETDAVICSNYQSSDMDALINASHEEIDWSARAEIYAQIQTLWADELPSLEITQEPRRALSLAKVDGVTVDALGLMHYELLTKTSP
jgi:peptide/nickel transport system substrate-binding protein